ncbi:MAG: YfhO family protein [Oscillospiraceae bacterium]
MDAAVTKSLTAPKRKGFSEYAAVFLLNFIVALASFGYFLIRDNGLLYVAGDFNQQQLMFNMLISNALRDGSGFWSWSIDLGSDILTTMSFYNIGSIFNWIGFLVPPRYFMYAVGWLFILKYAVAGLTSYTYLSRQVKSKPCAVIGSVMYAFSGFQAANIAFYHFHDVVAVFPLLMLTFDDLVERKKKGPFAAVVFLSLMTNYFFFIEEVVFLIIYYIVKYLAFDIGTIRRLPSILFEGILGSAMAAAIAVPSIISVLGNPRATDLLSGDSSLAFGTSYVLLIIRAFLFPAETMCAVSVAKKTDWSSTAAYLPMAGILFASAYVFGRKTGRNWLSALIKTLWVMALVPLLNGLFTMLSSAIYQRWFFMLVLYLVVATVKVLDEPQAYRIGRAYWWNFALMAAITLFCLFYPWNDSQESAINYMDEFVLLTAAGFLGLTASYVLTVSVRSRKKFLILMLCGTVAFSVFSTAEVTDRYQSATRSGGNDASTIYDTIMTSAQIEQPSDSYRFIDEQNLHIMPGGIHGTGSFCSTVSPSIMEFYSLMGQKRSVRTPDTVTDAERWFLSGKYLITEEPDSSDKIIQTVTYGDKTFYVVDSGVEVPGIARVYNSYITETDFSSLGSTTKQNMLFKAAVIKDDDESDFRRSIFAASNTVLSEAASSSAENLAAELAENSDVEFSIGNDSFSATVTTDGSACVEFTVPYSTGWSATVNGEEVKVYDTAGFMSVLVESGESTIEFTYETPGLKAGLAVSCISLAVYAAYCIIGSVRRKRSFGGKRYQKELDSLFYLGKAPLVMRGEKPDQDDRADGDQH